MPFRKIGWFIHRGLHGWAEPDLWYLDGYFCRLLSEAIPRLVEKSHGHPCYGCISPAARFDGELLCVQGKECECWEAYQTMLLDVAATFKRLYEDDYDGDRWWEQEKADWDEAMEFLKDWGHTLWD